MGAAYLGRNLDALAPDGQLVVIGMQGGRKGELDIGKLLAKRARVLATGLRGRPETGPSSKAADRRGGPGQAVAAGRRGHRRAGGARGTADHRGAHRARDARLPRHRRQGGAQRARGLTGLVSPAFRDA